MHWYNRHWCAGMCAFMLAKAAPVTVDRDYSVPLQTYLPPHASEQAHQQSPGSLLLVSQATSFCSPLLRVTCYKDTLATSCRTALPLFSSACSKTPSSKVPMGTFEPRVMDKKNGTDSNDSVSR